MSGSTQTILYSGKFLELIKEGRWEFARRVNDAGAAVIVALTADEKLLLVEQYRVPVRARTIELPAGLVGDEPGRAGESGVEAARRELLEETGYFASTLKALTTGPTSSGLTSERLTFFLASEIKLAGKGGGVAHENIMVHAVPLAEVATWLESKSNSGILIDPKVYAGLFFIAQNK